MCRPLVLTYRSIMIRRSSDMLHLRVKSQVTTYCSPEDYCKLCLEVSDEGVDEGGGDGDAEPPHHHVRELPESQNHQNDKERFDGGQTFTVLGVRSETTLR